MRSRGCMARGLNGLCFPLQTLTHSQTAHHIQGVLAEYSLLIKESDVRGSPAAKCNMKSA